MSRALFCQRIILVFKMHFPLNLITLTKKCQVTLLQQIYVQERQDAIAKTFNYFFVFYFSMISIIVILWNGDKVNWINSPLFICVSLVLILTCYFSKRFPREIKRWKKNTSSEKSSVTVWEGGYKNKQQHYYYY